jgi:hypothetical protein
MLPAMLHALPTLKRPTAQMNINRIAGRKLLNIKQNQRQ